jgi:hypothetical protein
MDRPFRIARMAEAAYGAVALFLGMGLPFPPPRPELATWVHWIGSGALALAVAWKLGKPNRAVWYVAALLSGYVLVNTTASLIRVGRGPALVVAAVVWVLQAVVAACLYSGRALHR